MTDGWVAASHRAGPCVGDGRFVWAPRLSRVLLHWGQVCETQSDLRPARGICCRLDCRGGRGQCHETVWLQHPCAAPMAALLPRGLALPRARGDGIWAGAEEKPWGAQKSLGGAAALPAPQGKVPNTCKDSGQSFSERGLLIMHVLRTHLGECNLPCGECRKILSGWAGWRCTREPTCGTGRSPAWPARAASSTASTWWTRYAWSWPERSPSSATKCSDRIILPVEPPAERGRGSFPCPTAPSSSPTSTSCNATRCGTPGRRPSPAPSAARVCRGGSRSASTTGAPRPSSPAPALSAPGRSAGRATRRSSRSPARRVGGTSPGAAP
nr:uncharacterized protein LOC125633003 isoform X2 [Caretta caretta]